MTLYVTRDLFKARVNLTDTVDDSTIDSTIDSVCREIDIICGRQFFATQGTRYYTARNGCDVLVSDLLSISELKTDDDGDRVYETTWASTDFDLLPENAPYSSPPEPFWRVSTAPNGSYSFPSCRKGVSITGLWGYYDVRRTLSATVANNFSSSATTLDVSSITEFQVGQTLWIGSEQLEIVTVTNNIAPTADTITVLRGVNGTTAAAIANGAAIQLATFPIVSEAAILMAQRHFHRRTSPNGIEGTDQMGTAMRIPVQDPDVRRMLTKLVLVHGS